jgi:glycosyltransferase involved in cell wall biosynthesis
MVRRVHAERPDLSAVIIGSGPLDLAVDAYLAEHSMHYVARLPGMDHARLQDYVRDAKIFALTSEYEGLGLVMIEAMNWGAQVISVDIPVGPREFLAETGIIVERDVQVFADKVIETLRQLEAEPVRTRQAESRVLDRFRYETALPELERAMIPSGTG